jgi:uncharacterized membrane protein YcaP (DUF421 family)
MSLFTLWDQKFLGEMFWLMRPVTEKMLRPILVYVFMIFLLRIFGKRELAQLNPLDLVVLLLLSNTVQNAIIGQDNSVTGGLIGGFTLCGFNYLMVRFLFRYRRLDQFVQGTSTVLIDHGKVQIPGLARELMTESDLLTVAHRQGFASLDEIERCVLEPGGTVFIQARKLRKLDRHHAELLARLERMSHQIEDLRQLVRGR